MTYRMDRSYSWNYEHGPQYAGPPPAIPRTPLKPFLRWQVNSRIGISAGLLLNSRWVETYARLGFDILTYKTVRTRYRPCYPMPNWVYIRADDPLSAEERDVPLVASRRRPAPVSRLTSAVCFGMPSMAPPVWRADVERARQALSPHQVLIVSVVGTPTEPPDLDALATDYAQCAAWAADGGAQVVEANLSCPNVGTAEGHIYLDPDATAVITQRIRDALPRTPLLVKAGHFNRRESLARFLETVRPLVDGVELVNCVSRRVHNPDGTPTFGVHHERVGILGWAIRQLSLANVRMATEIAPETPILAVGGVMTPEDPACYFEAGATAVMMGGSPMFHPHLAIEIKTAHPEW